MANPQKLDPQAFLMKFLFSLLALISPFSNAASPDCSSHFSAVEKFLGKSHSAAIWTETTQDDGKPLIIQLKEINKELYLVFEKTKEGLWAEGPATLCKESADTVIAKLDKDKQKLGKDAPRLIKWGFKGGAEFKLQAQGSKEKPVLNISITGWSGKFIPSDEKARAQFLE